MDLDGKRVASRKVPCELKEVVKFLAPFKLIGIWFLVFGARQVLDAARVNHSN
jgi:hypothetical protein